MTPHSVIFLGTSSFAVPTLRALASDAQFQIDLVVTQPDRPVGRKQLLTPTPVKVVAEELGLQIAQPEKIKELTTTHYLLPTRRPDYLIVLSYGQLLPQELLDLPTIAPINVHGSLLPHLRGASPVHHALLQGDLETGVTVQRMVKKLDAGPILSSLSITIGDQETYTTLHDTLAEKAAILLSETLSNPLQETPQDESHVTFCSKLTKEMGKADPQSMNAETIDRMVRALSPWPGITIGANKILEASLTETSDALALPCASNSTLYITKIQPASGKLMTGKAFGLGNKL